MKVMVRVHEDLESLKLDSTRCGTIENIDGLGEVGVLQ